MTLPILSAGQIALLATVATFVAVLGAARLLRAIRGREQLLARAEELAADPGLLSDPARRQSFLARWADRYDRSPRAENARERLRLAYLLVRPSEYEVLRLGMAAGLVYVCILMLDIAPPAALAIGLGAYFLVPRLVFAFRRDAYVNAFNTQLVDITTLMANSLRAGLSIQQAIGQVADRSPEPARTEFRQTHRELLLGDNLSLALTGMCRRVPSRELSVLVNAVLVQHAAGGNLSRVLRAMSNVLAERERIRGEIQAITAEARFSANIIQVMPLGLLVLIRHTVLGEAIFNTVPGWILLAIYFIVQFVVYLVIRRIMRIQV
jgi:tight adherence protein B